MKRGAKIALWVIGSLVVLVIGVLMSADIIASRMVQREVSKAMSQLPGAEAEVGGIYLNLLSGSAIVKDITFSTNSLSLEDTLSGDRAPGLAMHIPTLAVWNIRYLDLLREHRLRIYKVSIDDPELLVYIDEQHPESLLPELPKDTALEHAEVWLRSVGVSRVELNDFCARIHSTRSPLHVALDSLSTDWRDIQYDLIDSAFTYNDSVYDLSIRSLAVDLPDGLFAMEVHHLETSDQGPIRLGYTRMRNVISSEELADRMREPTTWIDLEVNSLETSALNPIRKAMAQDYTLDRLDVDVKRMLVRRDARYEPKTPFSNPRDFLIKMPVRFTVKQVNALARKVDVYFKSTDVNCGEMHLGGIHTSLTNVTNRPGAVWHNTARAPFGKEGKVDAAYTIHFDKAASFDIRIHGTNIETHDINSFLRPLVGLTCDCHIDDLDAQYSGDRTAAKGEFCMQYHGLEVQAHKEDNIPYKVVTKNAGAITQLANTLIPKSNPTSVDPAPRRYQVEWKNDEWKPYPLYLFGPVIDGVVKTMLPGLFVHKQAKKEKAKGKK